MRVSLDETRIRFLFAHGSGPDGPRLRGRAGRPAGRSRGLQRFPTSGIRWGGGLSHIALLCLLVTVAGPAVAAEIVGPATAIDADTIEIGGRRIDLYGIDAPEKDQVCLTRKKSEPWDCGISAQIRLMRLLDRQELRCQKKGTAGSAGNIIALCTINEADLGQMLIMQGWAFAAEGSGRTNIYRRAEMGAEAVRAGLWKRRFVKPWEWRAGKRPSAD